MCMLDFGSWSMTRQQIDINNISAAADLSDYISNGEWNLMSADVSKIVKMFNCCPESYVSLTYELVLVRKQAYYKVNFVLPISCVVMAGVSMFFMPPESGEMVSMSVTLLLSSTVFVMVVQDLLPVQSDSIPQLGKPIEIYCTVVRAI